MSEIKLQINNIELLERLIKDDDALFVEIKKGTATNFLNKHLNPDISEEISKQIRDIKDKYRDDVLKAASNLLGKVEWKYTNNVGYGWQVTYNDEIKKKIKEQAEEILKETLDTAIEKAVESFTKELDSKVDRIIRNKFAALLSETTNKVASKIEKEITCPRISKLELD